MSKKQIVWDEPASEEVFGNEAPKKVIVAKTEAGKEIQIVRDNFGYWIIQFSPGGELPDMLKGNFTQYNFATQQIEAYLAKK